MLEGTVVIQRENGAIPDSKLLSARLDVYMDCKLVYNANADEKAVKPTLDNFHARSSFRST
ncbi:hypothetical protein KTT_25980 [Tengunoibacter tsumagoiensis]|uniref:Uncharacterized protein n=1 Tax=Tengunoibacter tsumagoiensis TaxID=2014871 RepID=A0A402A112_9CHLR|nr:hypothetical protein KTT_25980 [Tengunoibacter tsumagoiensis]